MKKSELGWLRSKIKDLAGQGTAIRHRIQAAFNRARYDLWNDKRSIGDEARWMLLAYAFLRDVPYRMVEPTATVPATMNCTEEEWFKDIAGRIACRAERDDREVAVLAWLKVPEATDRKARREAAEARGQAARHSRLQEARARLQQAAE